jgi:hypothetical protein
MEPATKLLFLHIPKSAGTTLTSCLTDWYYNPQPTEVQRGIPSKLERFYDGDLLFYPIGFYKDPEGRFPEEMIPLLRRRGLKVVTGHFSYGIHEHIPGDSSYITVVRDPTKRILSLYYHLLGTGVINDSVTLECFLEGIPDEDWKVNLAQWDPVHSGTKEEEIRKCSMRMLDNDQTRRISGMEPPLGGCDESMFLRACENLQARFSLVGLTERFDETLHLLAMKCGCQRPLRYLPKLRNRAKPAAADVSDGVRAAIERLNHWDIKLYEYCKERFEREVEGCGATFKEKVREFAESNMQYAASHRDGSEWDIGTSRKASAQGVSNW